MDNYIYRVVNKVDGKSYVGSSIDVEQRFGSHIRESRMERSKNRKLYKAIREHGENNFYIEVLEKTNDPCRERYWINYYDTFKNGYNHTKDGQGNKDVSKMNYNQITITKDMIEIMIESYKKRPNIRVASKASGIPEKKIREILNENKVYNPNSKEYKEQFKLTNKINDI